jgi:cell division protease FtsH
VLLGDRTAEEVVFGEVSTGAQDDLQRATDLVRHMITRYGMSEALGLATFEAPQHALFLQVLTGAPREYSEDTARVIDVEIQTLLEAAHTRVRATLTAQGPCSRLWARCSGCRKSWIATCSRGYWRPRYPRRYRMRQWPQISRKIR